MARRVLVSIVLTLSALAGNSAFAQANLVFNASGQLISSAAGPTTIRTIAGTSANWAASGTTGMVARATSPANAMVASQAGNIRVAGTAVADVAANDLAGALVKGLRGGLVGLAATAAVVAVLAAAHYYWDDIQKSMIYNPAPSATLTPAGVMWADSQTGAFTWSSPEAEICGSAYRSSHGCHAISPLTYTNPSPGIWTATGRFQLDATGQQFDDGVSGRGQGTPGPSTCSNGVPYSASGGCAQGVPDGTAQGGIGPKIDGSNGPQIAGGITQAGGDVQANPSGLPQVDLSPGIGPTTTVTNPDGSKSQTVTTAQPNCVNNACNVSITSTTINSNPQGQTTGTQTTTTKPDASQPATEPAPDATKNCGLPSTPRCLLDETGTPASNTPLPNANALDVPVMDWKNALPSVVDGSNRQQPIDAYLTVPPVAGCTPFTLPGGLGSIDPCGPMEEVRNIMDYLWALAGFWIIVGMVKQSIDGG